MRISDADRQRAVGELTRHCGEGRLTLDELEERIEEVYAAADADALRQVFRELPPFRLEPAHRDEAAPHVPRRSPSRTPRSRPAAGCGSRMVGVPPCFIAPLVIAAILTWKVFLLVLFVMVLVPARATRAIATSRT